MNIKEHMVRSKRGRGNIRKKLMCLTLDLLLLYCTQVKCAGDFGGNACEAQERVESRKGEYVYYRGINT